MSELVAQELKYSELPGFSKKQIAEHYKLYEGYVGKYNQLAQMARDVDSQSANATHSEIREVNLEKVFALNAIRLHEAYFANLSEQASACEGVIKTLIEREWGSVGKWAEDFSALGVASRGWVVLAWDFDRAGLENYICDAHNQGGVWNSGALLVLDVYEHAYFLDYATARKDYITTFMNLVDWKTVNDRIPRWAIEKFTK
jgi:Fe-Mn family superoxide dismutase